MSELKCYSSEINVQIVISLLKAYDIKNIVVSPGATNVTFVASVQQDPFFQIYSSVDERSAAYLACGIAAETDMPVVISCTGATASRNYMPGLTEAYYRKLPIIAITSHQGNDRIGQLIPQNIDRRNTPNDIVVKSATIPMINSTYEIKKCELLLNEIFSEIIRKGGGPIHINLITNYSRDYSVTVLPEFRVIKRISSTKDAPILNSSRIAIFIGSHQPFKKDVETIIDKFCAKYDAVVFCDHTSSYKGKYRILYSLAASQECFDDNLNVDTLIHIGEISGDYYTSGIRPKEVWRVNLDGEMRDTFGKLKYVFEMEEFKFFEHYSKDSTGERYDYYNTCQQKLKEIQNNIPELPFSNVWIAQQTAHLIPQNSVLHLGILNTLRSWNFFEVDLSVKTNCNVGGFGIDGILSSLIGASLVNKDKIYFGIIGDLAFFYDMNVLGNRHISNNVRILLINNGKGTEFRNYDHPGNNFGEKADEYIAAAGHFGNKSKNLVKHFAEDLGYKYLTADNKTSYLENMNEFISDDIKSQSIIFEVFTDSQDESDALKIIRSINKEEISTSIKIKSKVRSIVGDNAIDFIKKIIH